LAAGIIVLAESNHGSVSIQRIWQAVMLLLALRFLGTQTGAEVNVLQVGHRSLASKGLEKNW
jgi:hypothetical protein